MIFLYCYRIVTFAVYLFLLPFGKYKSRRGDILWRGRLGDIKRSNEKTIWMHAASVGEVRVIGHLIDYLRKRREKLLIHLTVMTRAGYETAVKLYGNAIRVTIFPLDATSAATQTACRINPCMVVITETEIWFNLLQCLFRLNIPVILVNGRMSDKSFSRYRIIRSAMVRLIPRYEKLFLKTKSDLDRYSFFGTEPEQLLVVGDMKFDAPLAERSSGRIKEIRSRLNVRDDDFLFVAGSTRPGEEAAMLKLVNELKNSPKRLKLILAPRHINRADEIRELLRENGIVFTMYGTTSSDSTVILVDRMGLLNDLYLAADLAFVGGTLVDLGGHNLLEPVWAGTPVLYGPSISNVEEASEYIISNNYGSMVLSQDELAPEVKSIMSGRRTFAVKTDSVSAQSPTAHIGDYLLERLSNV